MSRHPSAPSRPTAAPATPIPAPAELAARSADIRICGSVDANMLSNVLDQVKKVRLAPADQPVLVEVTTDGGDADFARRIALELRLLTRRDGRTVQFIGKTIVYSAGITIMAAVPAAQRYLTSDTVLLIHERRLDKHLHLTGALRGCMAQAHDLLAELEIGHALECEGFAELIEGTGVTMEALLQHVLHKDWYVRANDAVKLGLVAAVV